MKPPVRSLRSRAIALLARREYSRAELRMRLSAGRRDGTGPATDEVEAVLDELVALGLLSDARYAHAVASRKRTTHSRRSIAATLKSQGVPADTIAGALAEVPADEGDAMRSLWQRRFGKPPADEREKARQVRFLQSRGFGLSAILRLLRDAGAADAEELS